MQPRIAFCQSCGSDLVRECGFFRRNCHGCKQPISAKHRNGNDHGDDASDLLQDAVFGHLRCGGARAANKKSCDLHFCVSCYYGVSQPCVLISRVRCSGGTNCGIENSTPAPYMCKHTDSAEHKDKPELPFVWVFDEDKKVTRAQCELCKRFAPEAVKPGLSVTPCEGYEGGGRAQSHLSAPHQAKCKGSREAIFLGFPRRGGSNSEATEVRRRQRSESPKKKSDE